MQTVKICSAKVLQNRDRKQQSCRNEGEDDVTKQNLTQSKVKSAILETVGLSCFVAVHVTVKEFASFWACRKISFKNPSWINSRLID